MTTITIHEVTLSHTPDPHRPWTIHGPWVDAVDFQSKRAAIRYVAEELGGARIIIDDPISNA